MKEGSLWLTSYQICHQESYGGDALAPHIDQRTMEIHHGKHHATDVTKLNGALDGHPDLQEKSVEELMGDLGAFPEGVRPAVRNIRGGHATIRCSGSSWDLTPGAYQPGPLPTRSTVPLEASTHSRGSSRPLRSGDLEAGGRSSSRTEPRS